MGRDARERYEELTRQLHETAQIMEALAEQRRLVVFEAVDRHRSRLRDDRGSDHGAVTAAAHELGISRSMAAHVIRRTAAVDHARPPVAGERFQTDDLGRCVDRRPHGRHRMRTSWGEYGCPGVEHAEPEAAIR